MLFVQCFVAPSPKLKTPKDKLITVENYKVICHTQICSTRLKGENFTLFTWLRLLPLNEIHTLLA